jgi:hypothetical protein
MWQPQLPDDPIVAGWWAEAETAREWETRRRADGIADEVRAERIERLRRRVHKLDMALAGAQSADRWRRIQRWYEQRSAGSYGDDDPRSWRGLPVEHAGAGGWILSVRR